MFSQLNVEDRPQIWDVDWVLNLRSVLLACENIRVYPSQIVISTDSNGGRLSFVHGVPGASGLASINFSQDKRKRRALMERAGVPIPKGATFSYGRGQVLAKRFAERTGFPVTLKPALGDNGVDAALGIRGVDELEQALAKLSLPPEERPHHNKSSYRMMLLDEPEREPEGLRVPPKYKFIVEKHIVGTLYRFLVSAGEIIGTVQCEGSPSDGTFVGGTDVSNSVDPELARIALEAANAVPEMLACAIDVVAVSEPVRYGDSGVVVDFHERPGLWVQEKIDIALAEACSDRLLEDYARDQNVALSDAIEDTGNVTVHIEVASLSNLPLYLAQVSAIAERFGVRFTPSAPESSGSGLAGLLNGSATAIAALINSAMSSASAVHIPEIALTRMS